jgi:hypothetical protein
VLVAARSAWFNRPYGPVLCPSRMPGAGIATEKSGCLAQGSAGEAVLATWCIERAFGPGFRWAGCARCSGRASPFTEASPFTICIGSHRMRSASISATPWLIEFAAVLHDAIALRARPQARLRWTSTGRRVGIIYLVFAGLVEWI